LRKSEEAILRVSIYISLAKREEMDKPIKSMYHSTVIGYISLHNRHTIPKARVKLERLSCGVIVLPLSSTRSAVSIAR
jgi:hypothetical protein